VDAVYTDTWLDMEFFNNPEYAKQKEEICGKMMPYQINLDLMEGSNAIVLHDMPMHAGFEISQPVIDAYLEHILDQAENRRHAEKAVMVYLMEQ
jgi:ornithine carbamoyltransferase